MYVGDGLGRGRMGWWGGWSGTRARGTQEGFEGLWVDVGAVVVVTHYHHIAWWATRA